MVFDFCYGFSHLNSCQVSGEKISKFRVCLQPWFLYFTSLHLFRFASFVLNFFETLKFKLCLQSVNDVNSS